MKKIKLSEKKLELVARFAGSRRDFGVSTISRATGVAASGQKANNITISQTSSQSSPKQDEKESVKSSGGLSSYIYNTVNVTTNSIYQEYTKYYSYITSSFNTTSNNNNSKASNLPAPSTGNSSPPPRRLDLHEIIVKPLIDLTNTSLSAIQGGSGAQQPPIVPLKALKRNLIRTQTEMKLSNELRLVELVDSLQRASSILIKSEVISDLFKLLYTAPELRFAVDRRRLPLIKQLIELKRFNDRNALKKKEDKRLTANINQCLALLGHVDDTKIKHAGVNILSLDGGGAKGFVAIEILKNIERQCNKPIHQIFDYICGTSTGACIAALLAIYKLSLDEIERQYKIFIKEIFQRNRAAGIGNLVMSYAYYDTKVWETMLQYEKQLSNSYKLEAMGDTLMINAAKESSSCKISIVSNITTAEQMKIFLFRNYNLPSGSQSHYEGTCRYKVWEAIRASTAAPIYHEDFKLDGCLFYDGGVLANNPTAIALHESRHLWPAQKYPNCVVSIGNGRFQPALDDMTTNDVSSNLSTSPSSTVSSLSSVSPTAVFDLSLKQKVNRIVAGISSTETVHDMLIDLLPASVYYRFNPYLSEEFSLDENRPDKWKLMQYETSMYMRRNKAKFDMASKQLCKEKSAWTKLEESLRKQIK